MAFFFKSTNWIQALISKGAIGYKKVEQVYIKRKEIHVIDLENKTYRLVSKNLHQKSKKF